MSLDTRWLVLVKDTTGRNPDKWVTLAELDSYINTEENAKIGDWKAFDAGEDGTLRDITEAVGYLLNVSRVRADLAYAEVTNTLQSQLVKEKLSGVEAREDAAWEVLRNKVLINPIINDEGAAASIVFDSVETSGCYYIGAADFGILGNSLTLTIIGAGVNTPLSVDVTGNDIVINLATDAREVPTTTFLQLSDYLQTQSDFTDVAVIGQVIPGHLNEVVDVLPETALSGGAMGSKMALSTPQLNNVLNLTAMAPAAGAPITVRTTATAISGEGDGDEITWTAEEEGELGNGISIDITLSAEATDIDITVTTGAIAVAVKTGEGTTATDVLNAVNAHAQAGLLVQGALTGMGGAITADSVETSGGADITAAPAGAIRYAAEMIYISVGESTASESNWMQAALTDPNGA